METTRGLYAQELVAKGKAEGEAKAEAEITQVIRLFVQKKTPNQISKRDENFCEKSKRHSAKVRAYRTEPLID